jgi:Spy/CpxP family protein refolding chaperone
MVAAIFATAAVAQTAQTPAQGERQGWKHGGKGRSLEALNLTSEQKSKLQALQEEQRSKMQALRGNTSLTEDQKKQQMRELRQSNHQQMLSILTPEQQAQMKELHAKHEGRREGFKAGRGFQALNLSEQQKAQMKPIFESSRQQMQALKADTSLTPEQKREKMKEIRQNQMSQVKSILTPEQQQQLQQMRGRRGHRGGEKQAPPTGF